MAAAGHFEAGLPQTMNSGGICCNFCIQPGGSYSGENNSG